MKSEINASFPPKPPSMILAMLEPGRAFSEFAGLCMAAPLLMTADRGDGHSVLVLPGFSATDMSTACLRAYLTYLGYRSEEWTLGTNLGYRTLGEAEVRLRDRVRKVWAQSGRKISLVGWSLGGVMARHMARDHPEMIRQVITLGAPFTGDPAATNVRQFYELVSGEDLNSAEAQRAWQANRSAPNVPTTSIYSRTDGVTSWMNCLEVETDMAENLEIWSSHMGLPHNPFALHKVADRLAQPEKSWRRYASIRN